MLAPENGPWLVHVVSRDCGWWQMDWRQIRCAMSWIWQLARIEGLEADSCQTFPRSELLFRRDERMSSKPTGDKQR